MHVGPFPSLEAIPPRLCLHHFLEVIGHFSNTIQPTRRSFHVFSFSRPGSALSDSWAANCGQLDLYWGWCLYRLLINFVTSAAFGCDASFPASMSRSCTHFYYKYHKDTAYGALLRAVWYRFNLSQTFSTHYTTTRFITRILLTE